MDATEYQQCVNLLGEADAQALQRFLSPHGTLKNIKESAIEAEQEWTEWAKAVAFLQRWLEERGRTADQQRKLGYLTCTIDGFKNTPLTMRPPLVEAVKRMLQQHGFAE